MGWSRCKPECVKALAGTSLSLSGSISVYTSGSVSYVFSFFHNHFNFI